MFAGEGRERLGERGTCRRDVAVESGRGLDRHAAVVVVEPVRDRSVGEIVDPAAMAGRQRTRGALDGGHSSTPIAPGWGTVAARGTPIGCRAVSEPGLSGALDRWHRGEAEGSLQRWARGPSGQDHDIEVARAVDPLDPVKLDVARRRGSADPGQRALRIEPGERLGDLTYDLI